MHTKLNYDTIWTIEYVDPKKRNAMKSSPVELGQPILLKHSGTAHYLASDLIEYRNEFGLEYEVSVHSYGTLNKSQNLILEKTGKLSRETPTKSQQDQNIWCFIGSQDPSTDFDPMLEKSTAGQPLESSACPVLDPALVQKFSSSVNLPADSANALEGIKLELLQRGAYGLRGLAKLFKQMDHNGNHKLEPQEFCNAMGQYGLHVDEKLMQILFEVCDKNRDGVIDYTEFLRFLRGDMNETRKNVVAMAYAKLDKNKDGKVTLDDVAANYSAQRHPEVLNGRKKPEDIYREYMRNWDTEYADGIVTLEEFMDYYGDLSALISDDEYFVVMVKNAWKL